ncbi:MAG: TetR/AcrR family transcriptional regulator [Defluviitaleaceae bacterium]|nr:TetR/AcrR family transcriptional regulator [Defluviitaleaceae bacterium]
MENFFNIRAEKQSHIINAALSVFGKQGYRKASLSDIAQSAGITKGMITYYFGSKKNLYLYLLSVIHEKLTKEINEKLPPDITDFFEKIKIAVEIQVEAIKKHPGLISFVNSMTSERDPDIATEIEQSFIEDYNRLNEIVFSEIGTNPLYKFVFWASSGFTEELYATNGEESQIDELATSFYDCLDMIKKR